MFVFVLILSLASPGAFLVNYGVSNPSKFNFFIELSCQCIKPSIRYEHDK